MNREFYTTSIVELGFMRVSLSPAYVATWKDAHRPLSDLLDRASHRFLPDDVSGTGSAETSYKDSIAAHLVSLADRHGIRLAALDKALTRVTSDGGELLFLRKEQSQFSCSALSQMWGKLPWNATLADQAQEQR